MKKTVVICRSNPIDPDPRVEKIARSLIADGFEVIALGWDRSGKLPTQQVQADGLRITRLRIPARYGSGLMNLPALLAWQIGLIGWLLTHRRAYQVIHACDFDTILPALLCKKLWKTPVIYDIFDFYADHLRRTPSALKRAIRRADYWAIDNADGVILVDDARREQISGSRPRALISIYNSPEDSGEPPAAVEQPEQGDLPQGDLPQGDRPQGDRSTSARSASARSASGLHLTYVGLLQVERGIFEIIEVLRRHPEWSLDLAGFGGDEERIVALAQNMPNITWHGRIPYQRALELSQRADVLFATYDPAIPNHRYSSPNKVFEGMMLGKPILVARDTNMDRMIEAADCGVVVEYGDINALEQALCALANDPANRKRLGENARRAYEHVYSWARMQDRLRAFYAQVLRGGPR